MKCQNCGSELPEESKFCTHCGAKIAAAAEPVPVVSAQPQDGNATVSGVFEEPAQAEPETFAYGEPAGTESDAGTAQAQEEAGAVSGSYGEPASGTYETQAESESGSYGEPVTGAYEAPSAPVSGAYGEAGSSYSSAEPKKHKEKPPKVRAAGGAPNVKTLYTVIGVLAAAAVGAGVYLGITLSKTSGMQKALSDKDEEIQQLQSDLDAVQTLEADYAALQADYTELQDYVNGVSEKLDFFDRYAVIVPNDGSNIYHKYGCADCNISGEFWIFNIDYAEYLEYTPCPDCVGP